MGRLLLLLILTWSAAGCEKSEPATEPAAKPAEQSDPMLRDQFGLPLELRFDVPEVPPEVQKPSPPIPKEPESL